MLTLQFTLAEFSLFVKKCATYQDPCYGSSPEAATIQALTELGMSEKDAHEAAAHKHDVKITAV